MSWCHLTYKSLNRCLLGDRSISGTSEALQASLLTKPTFPEMSAEMFQSLNVARWKEQFKLLHECWAIKHRPRVMFQVRRRREAGQIETGSVLHKSTSDFVFWKIKPPPSLPPLLPLRLLFLSVRSLCYQPVRRTSLRDRSSQPLRDTSPVGAVPLLTSTFRKQDCVKRRMTDFCGYIS